jgi:hypothetical protein
VLEVSNNNDDDNNSVNNKYKSLHPELVGWDNGQLSMAYVQDPFREQQELITLINLSILSYYILCAFLLI